MRVFPVSEQSGNCQLPSFLCREGSTKAGALSSGLQFSGARMILGICELSGRQSACFPGERNKTSVILLRSFLTATFRHVTLFMTTEYRDGFYA